MIGKTVLQHLLDISLFKGDGRGYMYLYAPKHPLANSSGKVRLHRYIASITLGRWLTSEEHVHHIDGNRLNNKPENLEVMSNSEHMRLHSLKGRLVTELVECLECGNLTKQKTFCSNSCKTKNQVKQPSLTKEQLEDLIWDLPYTKIALMLGMSDTGVKKAAIRLNCILPPIRFHLKSKEEKERIKREMQPKR